MRLINCGVVFTRYYTQNSYHLQKQVWITKTTPNTSVLTIQQMLEFLRGECETSEIADTGWSF